MQEGLDFLLAQTTAMGIQTFLLMHLISDNLHYRHPWSIFSFLFIHLKSDYLIGLNGSYSRALVIYTAFSMCVCIVSQPQAM